MEQFLCVLTPARESFPGDATDQEIALVGEHFAHLQEMLGRGELVIAGRTQDELERSPMGLVVFEASDLDTARAQMEADPAVAGGVFRAEVRRYAVALMRGE